MLAFQYSRHLKQSTLMTVAVTTVKMKYVLLRGLAAIGGAVSCQQLVSDMPEQTFRTLEINLQAKFVGIRTVTSGPDIL
jgi:hypothetical protein